jgi:hypothetical protein
VNGVGAARYSNPRDNEKEKTRTQLISGQKSCARRAAALAKRMRGSDGLSWTYARTSAVTRRRLVRVTRSSDCSSFVACRGGFEIGAEADRRSGRSGVPSFG